MNQYTKKKIFGLLIWLGIFAACIAYNVKTDVPKYKKDKEVFFEEIENKQISKVIISYPTNQVYVYPKPPGQPYYFNFLTLEEEEVDRIYDNDIDVGYAKRNSFQRFVDGVASVFASEAVLSSLLPLVFLLAFLFFLLRSRLGPQSRLMPSVKNAKEKIVSAGTEVSFEDIGGLDDMKEGVRDIIEYFKDPKPWIEAGVRLPRGIMLEGPPGTGKTLFARALATEAKAVFFSTSGPEFTEMFVGVGAARVRDLFENAKSVAPAIIFIDEIDAVGKKRNNSRILGSDEWDNTLNQLLACMDGFKKLERVLVIGATNRVDVLDPALLRAGRFDRTFSFKQLPKENVKKIFEVHLRERKLDDNVTLDELCELAKDLTGAEIETVVNEASMRSVRRYLEGKKVSVEAVSISIKLEDFQNAYSALKTKEYIDTNLDKLLIESDSQFIKCDEDIKISIELSSKEQLNGSVIWANRSLIKVKEESGAERVIGKSHILSLKD